MLQEACQLCNLGAGVALLRLFRALPPDIVEGQPLERPLPSVVQEILPPAAPLEEKQPVLQILGLGRAGHLRDLEELGNQALPLQKSLLHRCLVALEFRCEAFPPEHELVF